MAGSAGFTALVGITEPSLYGVTLKLKKTINCCHDWWGMCRDICRSFRACTLRICFTRASRIPAFIGENPMNIVHALMTIVIAFVVAFAVTWILGFEDPVDETITTEVSETKENQKEINKVIATTQTSIASPLSGIVVPLEEVNDDVFSSGLLGKGTAIVPDQNEVRAPFSGEVVTLLPSKHAIGLKRDDGLELLIHIGIDTVNLNGEFFTVHVQQGDRIETGDLLVNFDREAIKDKGYDIVTPIIITNPDEFQDMTVVSVEQIGYGQKLLDKK